LIQHGSKENENIWRGRGPYRQKGDLTSLLRKIKGDTQKDGQTQMDMQADRQTGMDTKTNSR
jgi:hypothetical protein